jgi:hypothetical protein
VGSPAAEALKSARKLLRREWGNKFWPKNQGILSIHNSAGKTVIQLGSSEYGSIYVTIPISLDPESMAENLLKKIARTLKYVFKKDSLVALYDGDYQNMNPKHFLTDHVIIRSTKDDPTVFLERARAVLAANSPSADNSSFHLGVPTNEAELQATFNCRGVADPEGATGPASVPAWDVWNSRVTSSPPC